MNFVNLKRKNNMTNTITKKVQITLPSLLSFERKLEVSDALMYSGSLDNKDKKNIEIEKDKNGKEIKTTVYWKSIPITKRYNRSTQSAYGIDDAKKSEPNPVSSDSDDANLFADNDTLKVSFSMRVIGGLGLPFACNEPDFEKAITNAIHDEKQKITELLAYRYAYNIANGRFLWRNRVGAEEVQVTVRSKSSDKDLCFNAYHFSLTNFTKNTDNVDFKKLVSIIQNGLFGDNQFIFLEVDAYVKIGKGQHVFPSQEMNMNEKGKVLFKLDNCAAMHNVKIGNAIRTIDDWYDNAEFPIAIEPFGSVTQRGQAYRKSKNDLYTLMINWLDDKGITDEDKAYVVANLIRGGVFSGGSKKKSN